MDTSYKQFIDHLIVRHGPTELLGRFFLKADTELRQRGVTLTFASFDELAAVNLANQESWHPLFASFDPNYFRLHEDNGFCLLGRNRNGEVVTTQAGRLFDWNNTTMFDELAAMRVFYDEPDKQRQEGETVKVTAEKAKEITGLTSFLGSIWVRPDYRRKSLPALMGRVSRAYALARWGVKTNTGMMTQPVFEGLMLRRLGTPNADWSVDMVRSRIGDVRTAVIWASASETIADTEDILANFETRMDGRLHYRRAE